MCLSGDISDLTDEQWNVVDEGMAFYRKCADVIKYGTTILIDQPQTKFNKLKGQQLLVREYNGTRLAILHRFEDSVLLEPDLSGFEVISEFGSGDSDFSAKAWLMKRMDMESK
jgi:alpha-galactosidase